MHSHTDLPSFRGSYRLGGKDSDDRTEWYVVKFWPYSADPVFAVSGGSSTVIYRCVHKPKDTFIEVIQWFREPTGEEGSTQKPIGKVFAQEWSRASNGDPLLCLSGEEPIITILNVRTGQVVACLQGHGKTINALSISPVDPTILASASVDHSVRVWSLDPAHRKQPTAVLCHGPANRTAVSTVHFHRKGQYLLSGGEDTSINMWLINPRREDLGSDKQQMIYYPHFSTTDIHTDYIDCVQFFGDFILSRCEKENRIVLWSIDNFSSDTAPPGPAPIPPFRMVKSDRPLKVPVQPYLGTRSAWGGRFQRLLMFDLPDADVWWVHFSLFHTMGQHPILAAGNVKSQIRFWDLQRLEEAGVGEDAPSGTKVGRGRKPRRDKVFPQAGTGQPSPQGSRQSSRRKGRKGQLEEEHSRSRSRHTNAQDSREVSVYSDVVSGGIAQASDVSSDAMDTGNAATSIEAPIKREATGPTTGIGDPFRNIVPHRTVTVKMVHWPGVFAPHHWTVRSVAWSPCGSWCIAAGEHGMIAVFSRWEKGVPEPEVGG